MWGRGVKVAWGGGGGGGGGLRGSSNYFSTRREPVKVYRKCVSVFLHCQALDVQSFTGRHM